MTLFKTFLDFINFIMTVDFLSFVNILEMIQAAPPVPHLVPATLESGGERTAAVDVLQRHHQGPVLLGGEKTILSLSNLQLRGGQGQPAHVELQVLEDLVLVLESGYSSSPGAPVYAPGVKGSDNQALGADTKSVSLDDKLHHLGGKEQEVLTPQQLLGVNVDSLEAGEGELLKQLIHLISVIVLVVSWSLRIVLTLSPSPEVLFA